MNTKNLFIISGPSAAGEDSVIKGLRQQLPIRQSITTTSRSLRSGESEGQPYYFVSKEVFKEKIDAGEMIEWDFHNGHYYGITSQELERICESGSIGIWKVDYQGVINAKKLFPQIVAIHISAGSLDVLGNRLRKRDGDKPEYIAERLEYAKKWDENAHIFDYTVINAQNELAQAIKDTTMIIQSHATLSDGA